MPRDSVQTFFLSALVALLALSSANAALLFQDRHTGPSGEQVFYKFEAKAQPATEMVEQSKAIKTAMTWATQYYGLGNVAVANAQERMMPTHFWLVALTVPERGKNEIYYAVVLPNGSLVEPQVSRQSLTAGANPIDVTKDSELEAPVQGPEIHGEIEFQYGWGKGVRYYGPFVPGAIWDGPAGPFHP